MEKDKVSLIISHSIDQISRISGFIWTWVPVWYSLGSSETLDFHLSNILKGNPGFIFSLYYNILRKYEIKFTQIIIMLAMNNVLLLISCTTRLALKQLKKLPACTIQTLITWYIMLHAWSIEDLQSFAWQTWLECHGKRNPPSPRSSTRVWEPVIHVCVSTERVLEYTHFFTKSCQLSAFYFHECNGNLIKRSIEH